MGLTRKTESCTTQETFGSGILPQGWFCMGGDWSNIFYRLPNLPQTMPQETITHVFQLPSKTGFVFSKNVFVPCHGTLFFRRQLTLHSLLESSPTSNFWKATSKTTTRKSFGLTFLMLFSHHPKLGCLCSGNYRVPNLDTHFFFEDQLSNSLFKITKLLPNSWESAALKKGNSSGPKRLLDLGSHSKAWFEGWKLVWSFFLDDVLLCAFYWSNYIPNL